MKAMKLAGLDIGGTKCAVTLGELTSDNGIRITGKRRLSTTDCASPQACLKAMCVHLDELLRADGTGKNEVRGIGISCGGPLDSATGIIHSPPNLPGWDDIPATALVEAHTGLPARLENDANAGALAEWKFGAGRGASDMIFLTFGTGLGAGIIANGKLIDGCSGMAGECGHIRLAPSGPTGYGKAGSFEGFCSGSGIAQLGRSHAEAAFRNGRALPWCPTPIELPNLTAKTIGEAAAHGDADALAVYAESGRRLGEGLAVLIDLLNPECIVIGSIFSRSENLLRPAMEEALSREALPQSRRACRIVPAQLGEALGDIASLAVAAEFH